MALIPNASNILTKGINETYGILTTGIKSGTSALGAMADKYKRDLAKGKEVAGGIYDNYVKIPTSSAAGFDETGGSNGSSNGAMNGPWPVDINTKSSGGGSGSGSNNSNDQRIIDSIGKGWDDSGDVLSATKKSLDTSKNYISNIGKVKNQYVKALDNYKQKTDDAIAGNKKLIEQNQKKDLDTLAGDTRKSMDNTNVMLGVKGASGGSASKAAARAIASSAGKTRASVLTNYGDETSKQNQAAQQALEDYNLKKSQADDWEKQATQQALDEYNAQRDALSRLNKKSSGWKDEDVKAASDKNLQNFMSSLGSIQAQAKAFRDDLAAKMTEYGGLADSLNTAAVTVDAPAELDTPDFNENIDFSNPNNAEDFYDPTKKGTRVVAGYDALGRPIDSDGNIIEDASAGA